jgi:hypothetical protein
MAAYPTTFISRESGIVPDAGIRTEIADDGTVIFRRDRAVPAYGLEILHEWVSQSEFDALLAFVDANGYGPHTLTLHGINFSLTLINLPQIAERKGSKYNIVSKAVAVRV